MLSFVKVLEQAKIHILLYKHGLFFEEPCIKLQVCLF